MSKKDVQNMCVCKGTVSDQNQIRCNWCQSWFHERCVGIGKDDPVGFWACTECRCVPLMVRTINEKLDEVLKVNQSIVKELNNKTTELQLLQTENMRLRSILRQQDTDNVESNSNYETEEIIPSSNDTDIVTCKGTLIAGSSVIKDITRERFILDNEPICVRGGRITDISAKLLDLPDDCMYDNLLLLVGSNDCVSDNFDGDSFKEDYCNLLKISQSVSKTVVISGMCPRLDDRNGHITQGNNVLKDIANDENVHFIDNDQSMRNVNGAINIILFQRDGVHLNAKGTNMLACNFELVQKGKQTAVSKYKNRKQRPNGQKHKREYNSMQSSHRQGRNGGKTQRKYDGFRTDRTRESEQHAAENYNRYSTKYHSQQWRQKTEVTCWYCGEKGHTKGVCRHGTYVQCNRCNELGHKANHCKY